MSTVETADGADPESSERAGRPDPGELIDEPTPAERRATAAATGTGEPIERQTGRWLGIGTLSLLGVGAGVTTGTAAPLLAGIFGLAFAGYSGLTTAPEPELSVDRSIDETEPDPGEEIRATVQVTNEGRWPLFDLRILDGVPDRLGVTGGSPRQGAVLLPGASTSFTYAVRAERGEHEFEPATIIARDVSGANETIMAAGEATTIRCHPEFPTDPISIPLRSKVSQFTGRFPGDTGGPGLEFHATRQYRRGDPLSRVDWRRTARTGELTTVEFRVERTVRVCLVFDVRDAAHLAAEDGDASAVERSVDAGIEAYASLTADGHAVGVGAIGPTDCWLSPGSGDRHRTAARHTFGTDPALSPLPPKTETDIYQTTQRLKGRLGADTQVMLFTPLCDERILSTAIRLDAHGYAVTVVSPDVTSTQTTGQTYARSQRRLRIADLRSRGVPVIDWGQDEELGSAIARTTERWSQ